MPKQLNIDLRFNADTAKARQEIQQLQQQLNSLMDSSISQTSFKGFSTEIANAQQSVIKLQSALNNSLNVDTGRLDLSKFNQQLLDSNLTINKLASDLSALGPEGNKAFVQVANSIITAQKPIAETNKLLNETWTAIKNTARWQISSSILHGFIAALQGALGYAQDLNKSLNSIRIVSGQTTEQMADFAEHANRAAQSLSTSTLAYTDAALIFYQQGLRGEEVTERVDTVLKLSNVTGQSAESVSSYMTAIWNNFDDGSASLESYADKITALGAATASSSEEIAKGMQQFAAVAGTVGLSYDYAATALATVVAQTRQSESTVGNSFRTIFSRLQGLKLGKTLEDGTDLNKYSAALETVGVNIKDQNGELKDMDTILDEIGAKWKTLAKDQQIALAQTVGGVRQYTNLVALFENWDQFQENLTVTQGAEGELQKQADIYAESWEAAKKRVKAAWQSIYQDLLDDKLFIGFNNGFASVLKTIDGLIDSMGGLKGLIFGLIAAWTTWKPQSAVNALDGIIDRMKHIALLGPRDAQTGQKQSWAEVEAEQVQEQTMAELRARRDELTQTLNPESIVVESLIQEAEWYNDIREKKKQGISFSEKELELIKSQIDHAKKLAEVHKDNVDKLNEASIAQSKANRNATRNLSEEDNKKFNSIFGEGANSEYQSELDSLSKINVNTAEYTDKVNELTDKIYKEAKAWNIDKKALEEVIDAYGRKAQAQNAVQNSGKASDQESNRITDELRMKENGTSIEEASSTLSKQYIEDEITAIENLKTKIAELKQENKELANDNVQTLQTFGEKNNFTLESINELIDKERELQGIEIKDVISDEEAQKAKQLKDELEWALDGRQGFNGINDLRNSLKDLIATLDKNGQKLGKNQIELEEAEKEASKFSSTAERLKERLEGLNNAANTNNNANQPFWLKKDFSNGVVDTARGLSSLTMAFTSFSSIIDTLNNKDLSGFEKIRNTVMSIGMGLPALINGWSTLTKGAALLKAQLIPLNDISKLSVLLTYEKQHAALKEAAAEAKLTAEKSVNAAITARDNWEKKNSALQTLQNAKADGIATSETALNTAAKEENEALNLRIQAEKEAGIAVQAAETAQEKLNTLETNKNTAALIANKLARLALVAAIGLAIFALYKLITAESESIKKENEAIEKNKEAVNNLNESYKNLEQTINSLEEKRKSIESLTKGTKEWTNAVNELNSEMNELIDKYGLVYKEDYNITANGIELTEKGQKRLEEEMNRAQEAARTLDISTEMQQSVNNQRSSSREVTTGLTARINTGTSTLDSEIAKEFISNILSKENKDTILDTLKSANSIEEIEQILREEVDIREDHVHSLATAIKDSDDILISLKDYSNQINKESNSLRTKLVSEAYNMFGPEISEATANAIADIMEQTLNEQVEEQKNKKVSYEDRAAYAEDVLGWHKEGAQWKDAEGNNVNNFGPANENLKDSSIQFYKATENMREIVSKLTNLDQIQALSKQNQLNELTAKFSMRLEDGTELNDSKSISNWLNSLDDDGLAIAASLDIQYGDTEEEIQNKFREAMNSKPIELDTSGFTKKQAAELQEEFENLTDYIYNNASESIKELDEHLKDCRREASQVAKAIMRMDDAIQDVRENYEDWEAALKSESWQDITLAANEVGKAYGNLLNINGDELSGSFKENITYLKLMKEAIEGNEKSYNQLRDAASQDLIMNVYFKEDEELQAKFLSLREKLQGIADNKDIKIGTSLLEDDFKDIYDELNKLVENCGLTADQASDLLSSMGIDAEVVQVPTEVQDVEEEVGQWIPPVYSYTTKQRNPANYEEGYSIDQEIKEQGYWDPKPYTSKQSKTPPGAYALKVVSAHKAAGGNIKYTKASNGGGSGLSKKSSGGSKKGSSSKKSTEKPKELTKKNTEEDRYHNIKEAIDDLTTALDRLSKNKDRAFGKQRLKYLDDEIKKTKEQVKLTEDYINEIKQYQKIDRGKLEGVLSSMGMSASDIASQFDENGVLKDYEQLYKDLQTAFNEGAVASLNKIEQEYNKAAEAWNASDQGDAAKAVWEAQKERLSNAQEIYKQQEETFKEQIEALKQYEETTNLLQEKQEELIDLQNKVYDQLVEVVKTKLEWKLELHENDRKLLEWTFKYIGDSADYAADKIANLSKQFDTTYKDIEDTQIAIQELFENHGINDLDFSSGNADEILKQLDAYAKSENLPILLTAEEVKTFEEYTQKLMADYDKLEEKAKEIHQTMMDATSEWLERIDKEVKKIDAATDKMQFLLDVINLTGKKDLGFTDEEIASFRQQRVDNAQAKVEISAKKLAELQKEADRVREELAKATDEDSRKRFQEDLDKYTEMIEDASAEWRDAYIDALEEAKKATEENLEMMVQTAKDSFGKFGLDFAQEQFARIKELSELYLPDYKKYSELNKSTNQLKKSLQETNNALVKGKMNDLLDEINEKMDSGVQMSETEAGIIERRVALLQAEAQLRDAQNAKSAVRMTRDNEGNFSYTYTADQDAIGAAGENYQEKFRELMEYEQNAIMEHQERMLQLRGDYLEAIKEAALVYGEGTEEFYEKAAEIYDYYQQKMDFETSQLNMLFDEQARLRDDDLKDIERIIGLKIAEEDNFTTFFNETVLSRVSGFETLEDFQQEWADMTQQTLDEAGQYWSQWKQNNEDILAGFRQNALEEFGKIQEEVKETKKSAEDMVDKMSEKFGENIEKTSTWEQQVGSKMAEMRKHITDTVSTINDMIAKLGEIGNNINNTASSAEQAAARLQQAAAQAAYARSILDGANGGTGGTGGNDTGDGDPPDTLIKQYYSFNSDGTDGYYTNVGEAEAYGSMYYKPAIYLIQIYSLSGKKSKKVRGLWEGVKPKGSQSEGFASGGYTGDWGNSSGKLAILHSKELVLNKDDTENMLNAVQLVRQMVAPQLSFDLGKGINYNALANAGQNGIMEQQVHIDASFPNVQSHTEIEMALNNLINSATQYVNRKK